MHPIPGVNAILQAFGSRLVDLKAKRCSAGLSMSKENWKAITAKTLRTTLANNSAQKSDGASPAAVLGLTSCQSQNTEAPWGNLEKSRAKGKGGRKGLRSVKWHSLKYHLPCVQLAEYRNIQWDNVCSCVCVCVERDGEDGTLALPMGGGGNPSRLGLTQPSSASDSICSGTSNRLATPIDFFFLLFAANRVEAPQSLFLAPNWHEAKFWSQPRPSDPLTRGWF